MSNLLTALDQEQARRDADKQQDGLRREYLHLLQDNDPAKAARLLDVAGALGQSTATVKSELAMIQAQRNAPAAAPATPADTSKMTGNQLLALGIAQQNAARPAAAPPVAPVMDRARMNGHQLLGVGIAEQPAPRFPQQAA